MSNYQNHKKEMIKLIQRYHRDQFLGTDKTTPYWQHCYRANQILEVVFQVDKQSISKRKKDILIATIGHDLYEDTSIDHNKVIEQFGIGVHNLIQQVTNEIDDQHLKEFIKKLSQASDDALIIKMADAIENNLSVSYTMKPEKKRWAKEFYLPIANANYKLLINKKFKYYKEATTKLKELLEVSFQILLLNNKANDKS